MTQWLKQSTAVTIKFGPFLDATNAVSLETGLATAMDNATTGIRVSKNGGNYADRNSATAPTYDEMGEYNVELSTTDTNTLGTLKIIFEESATCLPVWQDFMIVPANVWDSLFGADNLDVNTTQVGGQTASASGTVTFPAATLASTTNITAGIITTTTNLTTNNDKTGYSLTATTGLGNQTANIAGTITTVTGNVDGSVGSVTGAVGSVTGAVGSVTATVTADVDTIKTQAVTCAAGVTINPSVGAATIQPTVTEFNARSQPTADYFDWTTDAVANVTLVATTTTNTDMLTAAAVNAEVVDALNTDTYAEPGQGTPLATTSLAAKINYLYKNWRNRKTQTATEWALYNDDATTVDQKSTVSDNATTADKTEVITGP